MGKMKELLLEYETILTDMSEEQQYVFLEKVLFKKWLMSTIVPERQCQKPELEKFLRSVLPITDKDYHLFVQQDPEIYENMWYPYEQYINVLSQLCDIDCNIYYNVTAFDVSGFDYKQQRNVNAVGTKCIYIDIDDFDLPVMETSIEDIVDHLKSNFDVDDEHLPQYICKSGHGLHLYFILNDVLENDVRLKYFDYLNTHFYGDIACRPISHIIRCPFSLNCKPGKKAVRTELFRINKIECFTLKELSYYETDDSVIQQYKDFRNKIISEKRNATRKKNMELRMNEAVTNESHTKVPIVPKRSKYQSGKDKLRSAEKACTEPSEPDRSDIHIPDSINNTIYYFTDFAPHKRYLNLLMDLNNYVYRHGKENLEGKRNKLALVLANYCTLIMNKENCIEFCCKYFEADFYKELLTVIEKAYSRRRPYFYAYTNIAQALEFTQEDIDNSYCSFSEERRIQAIKNNRQIQNAKRHEIGRKKKAEVYDYIKSHLNESPKALAQICGVSKSTVYSKIKQIKAAT